MLKQFNNFRSLLLVLVLFAFSKSNAMPIKDVHSFCKETFEEDLCLKHIGSDQQRIVAARDFSDVFLIAATELQIQVNNAITHINNVRRTYVDPLGKERIAVCEKKYEIAADSFHKAWEVGQKKSKALADRVELSNRMKAGYEAVSECEGEWSKHGPKKESPLLFYYLNVIKLCQITHVIIGKTYNIGV
ncbi:PREDICTED: uncharacterized protein LOC104786476 [Camelina sativa]|uniref:Uncharacterized protein LOC104786476 n=1 Tax=Camelina sativa TaxID=90675 RepID=A0ABM0Z479_CAMSA|nr:PREDICTED: uncharacterized protein LOC104786476 [Camelina sativa]